jgi:hypothetical protein
VRHRCIAAGALRGARGAAARLLHEVGVALVLERLQLRELVVQQALRQRPRSAHESATATRGAFDAHARLQRPQERHPLRAAWRAARRRRRRDPRGGKAARALAATNGVVAT